MKVGDFGFARHMGDELCETRCGTPLYAAPEVGLITTPEQALIAAKLTDIWSLGIVIYASLTLRMG